MSELIIARQTARRSLLAGVSSFVLIAHFSFAAKAEDDVRPTVWVELGGQLETMQGASSPFVAPFMSTAPSPDFYKPGIFVDEQRAPRQTFGLEGKITFQPHDSNWTFSVGARYGRSQKKGHVHYQTTGQLTRGGLYYTSGGGTVPLTSIPPEVFRHAEAFADAKAPTKEQHLILDFAVGHDVGIGILGAHSTSNVSVGLRSIEFSLKSSATIYARPDVDFENRKYPYPLYLGGAEFNQYTLTGQTDRSLNALGPSLSWESSVGLLGHPEDGELRFDWGINAAVLFGKQKAETDHTTIAEHYSQGNLAVPAGYTAIYPSRHRHSIRSRSIAVPNFGGFAALSVNYSNVKVKLGYRADIFIGAVDAGIDERQTKNLLFHGPYAAISIGLGG